MPDGARLRWVALGSGPETVVVLHGGPGLHMGYLRSMVGPLARGRTLLLYDQRGRGGSELGADSARLSLAADADDLEALRAHFGLSHLTLLGHHYGAAVAARYARQYPTRVDRMVLVSPYFPRADYLYYRALEENPDAVRQASVARLAKLDRTDPGAFCREHWGAYLAPASVSDARVVRAGVAAGVCDAPAARLRGVDRVNQIVVSGLGRWDWRSELREVRTPVLLVQGDDDEVLAVGVREWLTSLPRAQLSEVRGPSQLPWLGARDETNDAIEKFLRTTRGPRGG